MAAYVTFIIGNGLDLSLGLKTSYKDFYEYAQAQQWHPQNRIYTQIKENPETWSDFELALGTYTHYIQKLPEKDQAKEANDLHEELEEIRQDLAAYLRLQEGSVENLPDKFSFSLAGDGFFDELRVGQRERIQSLLSARPVHIDFITLNYTKTLEKIISDRTLTNNSWGFRFRAPLHIHGNLSQDLTLGLSEESQLFSGMSTQEKDDLIKPTLIASMYDGRLAVLQQAINRSSLLVFFGTSIGETDKYLWTYAIDWLLGHPARHIIIHKYDRNYTESTELSSRKQKQFRNKVQNKLLDHVQLDESLKESLKERILVIHNTKRLFVPKD